MKWKTAGLGVGVQCGVCRVTVSALPDGQKRSFSEWFDHFWAAGVNSAGRQVQPKALYISKIQEKEQFLLVNSGLVSSLR
jgi:hypothetical protein